MIVKELTNVGYNQFSEFRAGVRPGQVLQFLPDRTLDDSLDIQLQNIVLIARQASYNYYVVAVRKEANGKRVELTQDSMDLIRKHFHTMIQSVVLLFLDH